MVAFGKKLKERQIQEWQKYSFSSSCVLKTFILLALLLLVFGVAAYYCQVTFKLLISYKFISLLWPHDFSLIASLHGHILKLPLQSLFIGY